MIWLVRVRPGHAQNSNASSGAAGRTENCLDCFSSATAMFSRSGKRTSEPREELGFRELEEEEGPRERRAKRGVRAPERRE
eukprot:3274937-Pleurochrysis_carterae.AAC.1